MLSSVCGVRWMRTQSPRVLVFVLLTLLITSTSSANNILIEKSEWISQDTVNDTVTLEFDISWDNSWNDSVNHDAAWVFVKYDSTSGDEWLHCSMNAAGTNPTGFSQGSGTGVDVVVPSDKRGAFIRRNTTSSGTTAVDDIRIVWDYGEDGVTDANAAEATVSLRIYGIEMVYVPEEGFDAGDGNGVTAARFTLDLGGGTPSVTSEAKISFSNADAPGNWTYTSGGNGSETATNAVFEVGENWPKGFQAFYAMKYEVSQGQYRDFLNALDRTQQDGRVASTLTTADEDDANTYVMVAEGQATVAARQGIKAGSNPGSASPYVMSVDLDDDDTGDETNDGEWIAMNYLNWMDLAAFLDWAALRPMTELEYEKLARGPIQGFLGEYAWGTSSVTQATGAMTNSGQASEVAANTANGIANYDGAGTDIAGPARVGFLATSSTNTRITSGGGYWGAMELTGNLEEMTVTLGNTVGRSYAGTHGDGKVTTSTGNATNPDWPGIATDVSEGVTNANGSGYRGGDWNESTAANLAVSFRTNAALISTTRTNSFGGRGVRTEL